MYSFEFEMPTKIIFGKGEIKRTGEIARAFGKKAMLVTSREESVKKRGFTIRLKTAVSMQK